MDAFYLILAGGKGERLLPLTAETPKPLVRFGSRGAIMDYTLYNCLVSRGGDALVLTQYLSDMVERYLRVYWTGVFASAGVKLTTLASQDTPSGTFRGTADAVRQALATLGRLPEAIVVLAGDHVYRMNYQLLLEFHRRHGRAATVAAIPCDPAEAHRFGIMTVDQAGCVRSFCEKPRMLEGVPGEAPLASMGIYAFTTRKLLALLEADRDGKCDDFGKDLIPMMAGEGEVRAFLFQDGKGPTPYWMDVGDLPSYWQAQMDLLDINNDSLKFQPFPGMGRLPFSRREIVAEFDDSQTRITRSAIADTARIGRAVIEHSVIGPGVTVEEGAVIRNSVVLDGARVRARSLLHERVVMPMAEVRPDGSLDAYGQPRPLALTCPHIYQHVPAARSTQSEALQ